MFSQPWKKKHPILPEAQNSPTNSEKDKLLGVNKTDSDRSSLLAEKSLEK